MRTIKEAKVVRRGEWSVEALSSKSLIGQRDATGSSLKKALKPAKRRELIDHLRICYQVSVRQAADVLQARRSPYYYRSRKNDQEVLRAEIKDLSRTYVRYGYRRIHTLLQRKGWQVNHKRVRRLYCAEGLQLRNKTPKRKVSAKLREDRHVPASCNDVWAMDFVADNLFNGQRLKILTIIDAYTKISPHIGVAGSFKAINVIEALDAAVKEHGIPKTIRVDNGPEFISKELDLWAYSKGITLDFSRPGKPTDNAFIEAFNSRFRQECLNTHWFLSLNDAINKIEEWRRDYNYHRPHSAIGNIPPIEFAMQQKITDA